MLDSKLFEVEFSFMKDNELRLLDKLNELFAEELYQDFSVHLEFFNSKSSIIWLGTLNKIIKISLLTSCFFSDSNRLWHILLIYKILMTYEKTGFYITKGISVNYL